MICANVLENIRKASLSRLSIVSMSEKRRSVKLGLFDDQLFDDQKPTFGETIHNTTKRLSEIT